MPTKYEYYRKHWAAALKALTFLTFTVLTPSTASAQEAMPDTRGLAPDFRLEIIAHQIATSSAGQCTSPKMLTGMMLHDEAGFNQSIRAEAKRWHGLDSGFGITRIVPDSPAAQAGLMHGDEIIAIGGEGLSGFARKFVKRKASYARTEQFIKILEERLQNGPVSMRVRRSGIERDLSLSGAPGCGGYSVLVDSNELNAWSDGRYIAVTTRMMRFAGSDDELAFVVAHEMAHNILKHSGRFGKGKLLLAEFGIGSSKVREAELAADALAIEMMASAGFDLAASEALLLRSGKHRGLNLSLSHPGILKRVAGTREARNQLTIRQAVQSPHNPMPDREAVAVSAVALLLLPPIQSPEGRRHELISATRSNAAPETPPLEEAKMAALEGALDL